MYIHRRARIGVTETILWSRHRDTLAVHHRLVPVAKSKEPATLDPELLEQGIEFPLPNEIRVPWRSVARGEEQPEPIRSPLLGEMGLWGLWGLWPATCSSCFMRRILPRLREYYVLGQRKARSNTNELEKQAHPWRAHCTGDDAPYVCAAQGRRDTECSLGAVSGHSWSVVDLCSALREAEVAVRSETRHAGLTTCWHKTAFICRSQLVKLPGLTPIS